MFRERPAPGVGPLLPKMKSLEEREFKSVEYSSNRISSPPMDLDEDVGERDLS
jgi:hypothetical protein